MLKFASPKDTARDTSFCSYMAILTVCHVLLVGHIFLAGWRGKHLNEWPSQGDDRVRCDLPAGVATCPRQYIFLRRNVRIWNGG